LVVAVEPIVHFCAGGPFLLPGWPGIPAPEFCPLGAVAGELFDCADAVTTDRINAHMAAPRVFNFMASTSDYDFVECERPPRAHVPVPGVFLSSHIDPAHERGLWHMISGPIRQFGEAGVGKSHAYS
jgi:hypothetical protein